MTGFDEIVLQAVRDSLAQHGMPETMVAKRVHRVQKDDGTLCVKMDVAGVPPENVKWKVEGDTATLTVNYPQETNDVELRGLTVNTSIKIPAGVDASKVTMKSDNGQVDLDIPKAEYSGGHTPG